MAQVDCQIDREGCAEQVSTPCAEGSTCVVGDGCVELFPASCAAHLARQPGAPDGPYMIDLDGAGGAPAFQVRCDMTTDGGGWTLVAANAETTTFVIFDRDWDSYRDGFGDLAGGESGWLGNARIHDMTQPAVELAVRHDLGQSLYADFSVDDEDADFQLSVSNTADSNDAGRFENYHSGRPFSTFDQDNDTHPDNCSAMRSAGWWYVDCYTQTIASGGGEGGDGQVYWRSPGDGALFVDWIEMWIR